MSTIFQHLKNKICSSAVCTALGCCILLGCQPKAQYDTIQDPMKGFTANISDTVRGAASIQELTCYFFIALQGKMTFRELSRFTPDTNDIRQIYKLTQTPLPTDVELRMNADTIFTELQIGFNGAKSKATVLHAEWSDATLKNVRVIEVEDQKLPSKKIVLEASDGTTTLRASAMCMQIGNRWFIGEDIRYGV